MRRPMFLTVVALLLVPVAARAQSSIFGTRALGLPVLPLSAKAQGMGGGNAMFDPELGLNPASYWLTERHVGTISIRHFWRDSENDFGSAEGNDTQVPLVMVTGPIGRRWDYGISVAGFTDRTFALSIVDTINLRGSDVEVSDTLRSKGGTTDIRAGVAYTVSQRLAVGLNFHMITGTNQIEYRRHFNDSSYIPVRIRNELSVSGPGISFGVSARPASFVRLAGLVRVDSDLNYYKDSLRLGDIPMPVTVGGGIQVEAGPRLLLAGQGLYRNWSVADDFIVAQGGVGASNTIEGAFGVEYVRDPGRPSTFPIRVGVRYATLPFPAVAGQKGQELQLSFGTGFRFTAERGSLDFAIERTWRGDGDAFKERTFMISVGVGIRP